MAQLRQTKLWVKLIAMSGRFAGTLLRAVEYLGAPATIAKPIERDELLNTVARVLSGAGE
jgi:hypothetical protein